MSLVCHLDIGRSDRVPIDRPGTLRDQARRPIDVVVENLSATGCLFLLDQALELGALVSIGIPGIGVRHARISRVEQPQYACAFLAPVGPSEIAAARSAETIVARAFPGTAPSAAQAAAIAPPPPAAVEREPTEYKLPVGTRVALIVTVSMACWLTIATGVVAIVR